LHVYLILLKVLHDTFVEFLKTIEIDTALHKGILFFLFNRHKVLLLNKTTAKLEDVVKHIL